MITLDGELEVDLEGIRFTIDPQEQRHILYGLAMADRMGIEAPRTKLDSDGNVSLDENEKSHRSRANVVGAYIMMERISAWDGPVLKNGKPAPCDRKHKERLFGKMPELLTKLFVKVSNLEGEEEKNSQAS